MLIVAHGRGIGRFKEQKGKRNAVDVFLTRQNVARVFASEVPAKLLAIEIKL